MSKKTLTKAEAAKKDELYTQFSDIQNEMNSYLEYNPDVFKDKVVLLPCDDPKESSFTRFFAMNFERFGLKKLISTSYASDSKKKKYGFRPDFFASSNDGDNTKGKIFTLSSDINGDGKIDFYDLECNYLKGDGDFASKEVSDICDDADIVVTHPPFSLFKEFVKWLIGKNKDFMIVANHKQIVKREILDSVLKNKVWLGKGFEKDKSFFSIPAVLEEPLKSNPSKKYDTRGQYDSITGLVNFVNYKCWITNIEHGRKHQPLPLMTMDDNRKYLKSIGPKANGNGKYAYQKYQNYNAIEVPFIKAIPSDYTGIMGVPFSIFKQHCPEQFEILGIGENLDKYRLKTIKYTYQECKEAQIKRGGKKGSYDLNACPVLIKDGILGVTPDRILIRHKKT